MITSNLIAQCITVGGKAMVAGACPTPGQTPNINTCLCGGQTICGPIPITPPASCAAGAVTGGITVGWIIAKVMGFIYPISGIILFFIFVSAGYDYLMSYGEPEKINTAWSKITYGLIGFGILIASYMIVRVVALIMGFESPF